MKKFLAAFLFLLLSTGAQAQTCGTVSSCPTVTLLNGAEFIYVVQNGVSSKTTVNAVRAPAVATSITTNTIGTGSRSFAVTGAIFAAGQFVSISSSASPTNFMSGIVTSFNGNILVVNSTTSGGSGTFSSWNITLSGAPGPQGPVGTGNVVGPASATSGDIATYNGTTGKIIQDSGVLANSVVTGPASVTNGDVAIFNGTTGKIIQDGGAAATTINGTTCTLGGSCSVAAGVTSVSPQGRLTLVSHTPVMTTNETAKSTIYYDSYVGGLVSVYNGTSDVLLAIGSNEISDAVPTSSTGVANASGVFDEWAVSVSGTLTLCHATNGSGGGWASDTGGSNTARGSVYSALDKTTRPYITNAATITHCYNGATDEGSLTATLATYLGTVYTTGAGATGVAMIPTGASGGAAPFIYLYNEYNRRPALVLSKDTSTGWSYASATWRSADNSASNRVSWVDGNSEVMVEARWAVTTNDSTNTGLGQIGVNFDSTSATPTVVAEYFNPGAGIGASEQWPLTAKGVTYGLLGLHYAQAMESGANSTNAPSFYLGYLTATLEF